MTMDHAQIDDRSLAERYVAGTLPPEEREAFEEHLVDCPLCLDRIEEAERIRGGLAALEAERAASPSGIARLVPVPLPRRGRAFFRVGLALAAGLALGMVPSLLALRAVRRADAEAGAARQASADADRRSAELAEALRREQAAREGAEAALARAERPRAVATLALASTRGGGGPRPLLKLPPDAPFALLTVETGGYPSFRARVRAAGGQVVWEADRVPASRYGLALALPARVLPAGDYLLELEGLGGGRPVPAGRLEFRVVAE